MCLQGTGDLHRCEHKPTGRMDHKIDWYIVRGILDGRNYRLGILEIDVTSNGKAEKAAFLLPVDHRDNARCMRLSDCANCLSPSHRIPPPREEGLQHHDCDKDPKQ
jgi:hypothetical protein